MTFTTNPPLAAALSPSRLATATTQPGVIVPGALWRAALMVGDLLGALGIVLCLPFVILAVGLPIALCLRLLLWMTGML